MSTVQDADKIMNADSTRLEQPSNRSSLSLGVVKKISLTAITTGSAKAIGMIYPELDGKLNGHAVRVPIANSSLTDCVFEVEKSVSTEDVNALFHEAADNELNGILGIEDQPLVSTDFVNDPRSSIVDAPSTMIVNGTQVKVLAWYDNEWGYVNRMVDLAVKVARSL